MTVTALICGRSVPEGVGDLGSPGVDVAVVDDLCRHPASIARADGASRLVLGVCPEEADLGPLQAQARRVGVDALGVEILPLGEADRDPGRLRLRIAGAAARARAFDGDETHDSKLVLPARLSRREALGFARPRYVPAPSVNHRRCAVGQGCRACVEQCPAAALAVVDQSIERDRDACVACGRCVTACPAGAVHNPGITPAQLHAQIRALLDPGVGPQDHRGIVFTCRRATPVATNGWYPVTVPCAGMVPPAWLLAPLVMGAGAVAAADCPDDGCLLASAPDRGQAVAWCRAALQELGLSPPRVSAVADGEPPEPLGRVPLQDPFSSSGIAEVLLALTALAPSVEPAPIEAEGSPLGVVELAEEACTLCGTCAQTCPTGALGLRERANRASVSFDHGQCTACGLCVDRCPEGERGAISMSRRTDLHMLHDPRATLAEDRIITCESCGSSITTAKVMRRLDQLIGDHPGVLDHASRYCIECRGSKSGPPGPASAVFAGPPP